MGYDPLPQPTSVAEKLVHCTPCAAAGLAASIVIRGVGVHRPISIESELFTA
jgi:hypothetical protein